MAGVRGSVATGTLVGIMGESGSGKTTLLQTLSKQLPSSLTALGKISVTFYLCLSIESSILEISGDIGKKSKLGIGN